MITWRNSTNQRGRRIKGLLKSFVFLGYGRWRRGRCEKEGRASLSVFFAGTLRLRQPESQSRLQEFTLQSLPPPGFTLSLSSLSVREGLGRTKTRKDTMNANREAGTELATCETMCTVKASERPDPMRCRGGEASESSPALWTRQVPRRGWPSWAQRIGSSKATESPKAGGAELERKGFGLCEACRSNCQGKRVGGVVARRRGAHVPAMTPSPEREGGPFVLCLRCQFCVSGVTTSGCLGDWKIMVSLRRIIELVWSTCYT